MGMGKILLLIGGVLLVAGLIFHYSDKLGWFGRLPGDIVVEKEISDCTSPSQQAYC